ncbi:phage/plasmid primase, P4 family [Amycolatopsis nalaikhensis]|uniref:Phage/plasmid primase, P4 family n=1 Tax=Amycolatopsis nalaikhensis TaxID=715472 RepID=A0ABY8XPA2_9PSEU|nr:phage/plasmid primase, P4 family [Amycolatopsis sp. 2-2]WIV57436.1 phage/plasmid primase, P4 family [Amycolatopsis sp. 2-2]
MTTTATDRTTFLDFSDAHAWAMFPINGQVRPKEWQNTKHGDYEHERLSQASGVGVVLDHSGLAVIDIDPQNGGSIEAVEERFGHLPHTFTVATPSGGTHLYFTLPAGVEPLAKVIGKLVPGVDFLSKGCYVAAPTTVREAEGKKPAGAYDVIYDVEPVELPAAVLAAWVGVTAAKNMVPTASVLAETHPSRYADVQRWHRENVGAAAMASEGERDDTATRMIFASVSLSLGVPDHVLSVQDIKRDFAAIDGFAVKDLSGKIDRALNTVQPRTYGERIVINDRVNLDYAPSRDHLSTPEARSDAAQIDRLTNMLDGQVIHTAAGWFVWNGTFWESVESITWVLKEACKLSWSDLRLISEPSKDQVGTVNHWNRPAFWAAAETALQEEPRLKRKMSELDSHAHLLNARNGTIDLRTGVLLPHRPDDYLTRIVDTEYDPDAQFSRWDLFLREIFPNDPEMAAYLQRFLGYAITGETSVHVYPVWAGVGRNGKSVLVDAVKAVLGRYMVNVRTQALEQGGNAQETEISRLRGVRVALLSETNQGMRVDEAELKKWTGDTTLVGRELYGKAFEYERQFQIIQVTNHEPRFMSQGLALWERVRLVRFNRVFRAHEQDKTLPIVLQSDAARKAILAWMVSGSVDFYRDRALISLPGIEDSTGEYKADQNPLDDFLQSDLVGIEDGAWSSGPALYAAYKRLCDSREMSGEAVKRNTFYDLLVENGFEKKRHKTQGRGFVGISVNLDGGGSSAMRDTEQF